MIKYFFLFHVLTIGAMDQAFNSIFWKKRSKEMGEQFVDCVNVLPYQKDSPNAEITDKLIKHTNRFCKMLTPLKQKYKNKLLRGIFGVTGDNKYYRRRTAYACALFIGADPNTEHRKLKETILTDSVIQQDYALTDYALKKGADPNKYDVLFLARSPQLARLLIQYNADVTAREEHFKGSLIHRCIKPHYPVDLLKMYVEEHKLDVNVKSPAGHTPLFCLERRNYWNKEEERNQKRLLLLQAGAIEEKVKSSDHK